MPSSADLRPLRCHLLIGPPASGKSTLATVLAELTGALVLSNDTLRAEVFGDETVQGPWRDIEALLHARLREAVLAGTPVILDATHSQRPWRLAITQALELPAPVQWIGWWLTTPLDQCHQWNLQRSRQVDPAVIERMIDNLSRRHCRPERHEGFADLVEITPNSEADLRSQVRAAIGEVEHSIRYARMRKERIRLHRYSRLLDYERLLHLIRLLLEFPGLKWPFQPASDDSPEARALRASFRYAANEPLPSGEAALEQRAAFALAHRHGPCYGDVAAIGQDLDWLEEQGFTSLDPVNSAIQPGPPSRAVLQALEVDAGFPPAADRPVFQRQMALLRHLIQHPFDRAPSTAELHQRLSTPTKQTRGRRRIISGSTPAPPPTEITTDKPAGVRQHLLRRLEAVPDVSYNGQVRRLDKDIELLLTPYGFRDPLPMADSSTTRSNASRRGIALGTALLTATQLREVHTLIKQSYRNLKDPTLLALQEELEERLAMAGVAVEEILPVRGFANRSIIDPQQLDSGTMAHSSELEKVEEAILERRLIRVRVQRTEQGDGDEPVTIWPLQILFHNIAWYLAYETRKIGQKVGLLSITRLDRLRLVEGLREQRPIQEARAAQARLTHLCRRSGGIFLGGDASQQERLGVEKLSREQLRNLEKEGVLQRVRFCCTSGIHQVFLTGTNRFPPEQMQISGTPDPSPEASHPHPVELLLPVWTVTEERDFRRWLFGFGNQIRIEAPEALRDEHRHFGAGIASLYDAPSSTSMPPQG